MRKSFGRRSRSCWLWLAVPALFADEHRRGRRPSTGGHSSAPTPIRRPAQSAPAHLRRARQRPRIRLRPAAAAPIRLSAAGHRRSGRHATRAATIRAAINPAGGAGHATIHRQPPAVNPGGNRNPGGIQSGRRNRWHNPGAIPPTPRTQSGRQSQSRRIQSRRHDVEPQHARAHPGGESGGNRNPGGYNPAGAAGNRNPGGYNPGGNAGTKHRHSNRPAFRPPQGATASARPGGGTTYTHGNAHYSTDQHRPPDHLQPAGRRRPIRQ